MDFDDEMVKKIDALKKHYGLTQTTELVRFIISSTHWNVQAHKRIQKRHRSWQK